MKKTKRFLALILALILTMSGILSGIPGGGVARAEEWDVGSEIVGDGTVEDLAGEPWAEESSSSAVVEEEDSSNVIEEEESQDGEEETLTNVVFGEYDPASAAETSFELSSHTSLGNTEPDLKIEEFSKEETTVPSNGSINDSVAENDSFIEDECVDETGEMSPIEKFSGNPGDKTIYFTNANIKNANCNDSREIAWKNLDGNTTYYVHMWGGRNGTQTKTMQPESTSYTGIGGSGDLYSCDIENSTGFLIMISPDTSTGNPYQTENAPTVIDGEVYKLKDYPQNNNNSWDSPTYKKQILADSEESYTGGGGNTGSAFDDYIVIYLDASLSAIPMATDKSASSMHATIPSLTYHGSGTNQGKVNTIGNVYLIDYHVGWGNPGYYIEGTLLDDSNAAIDDLQTVSGRDEANKDSGTLLYRFLIPKSRFKSGDYTQTGQDYDFFFDIDKNGSNEVSTRTPNIKLPSEAIISKTVGETTFSTIEHNCFYLDNGETSFWSSTKRGGYWGEVEGPRDPSLRAQAQDNNSTFYNNIGTSNDEKIVGIGSITTSRPSTNSSVKYVESTFYDYYTDYEISGGDRDLAPHVTQGDLGYRDWYPFMSINKALSAAYEGASEDVALYVGHFQTGTDDLSYAKIASQGDWLYDYYGGNTKFLSFNNSALGMKGENAGAQSQYKSVSWGLVDDELNGSGEVKTRNLMSNNGTLRFPLFDEGFLERGENVFSAKLGKVYTDVQMPFWIDNRTSSAETNPGKINYYVFAARYDQLGSGTNVPSANRTYDYGDVGTMKKDKDGKYYIELINGSNYSGAAKSSYPNRWNLSAGSDLNDPNVKGMGFFPFNAGSAQEQTSTYNYGYGMKLVLEFDMRNDGKIKDTNNNWVPMEFKFAGDDDVWVFIDGALALDLGGDHALASGSINFAEAKATVHEAVRTSPGNDDAYSPRYEQQTDGNGYPVYDNGNPVWTDVEQNVKYLGGQNNTTKIIDNWNSSDTQGYTHHTLTMYYMERGMWESNMTMEWNIPAQPADAPRVDIELKKAWSPSTVSPAVGSIRYEVMREDPTDHTEAHVDYVTLSAANNWEDTDTIKNKHAFVDITAASPVRYVYKVYELDADYDDDAVESIKATKRHLVASIGGNGNNTTASIVNRTTAENVSLEDSTSTPRTVICKMTGAGEIKNNQSPYYEAPSIDKKDATYIFTATNEEMVEVNLTKDWERYNGTAYSLSDLSLPSSIFVKLERSADGGTNWSPVQITPGQDYIEVTSWSYNPGPLEKYDASGNAYTYRYTEVTVTGSGSTATITSKTVGTYYDGWKVKDPPSAATVSASNPNVFSQTITNQDQPLNISAVKSFYANGGGQIYPSNTEIYLQLKRRINTTEDTTFNGLTSYIGSMNGTTGDSDFDTTTAWTGTWTGLPKYGSITSGDPAVTTSGAYTYYVEEVADDQGTALNPANTVTRNNVTYAVTYPNQSYTTSSDGTGTTTDNAVGTNLTVYNTEKPTTFNLTISKAWRHKDGSTVSVLNAADLKTTVNVLLYRTPADTVTNGATAGYYKLSGSTVSWETAQADATQISLSSSTWSETISGLDAYAQIHDNAVAWVYKIYEVGGSSTVIGPLSSTEQSITLGSHQFVVTGADVSVTPNVGTADTTATYTVTNTLVDSVGASLQKTWTGPQTVPGNMTFKLQRKPKTGGGSWEDVGSVITLTVSNGSCSHSTDNLTRYTENGVEYEYRYVEWDSTNSMTVEAGSLLNGFKASYTNQETTGNPTTAGNNTGIIYTTTAANTAETVQAVLTKKWVKSTAPTVSLNQDGTIYIKLERGTSSAWPASNAAQPTDYNTYTITRSSLGMPTISASTTTALGGTAVMTLDATSNDWVLTVSDLLKVDSSGSTYYYRFKELDSSSADLKQGERVGGYAVDYNVSVGEFGSATFSSNSYTQTIKNVKEKVSAVLTKEWPASTADSIIIQLEKSTSNAFADTPTIIEQYTINKPNGGDPTFNSAPQVTSASLSAAAITGGTSWILTVSDLDKYDSSNTPIHYRFVEMRSSTDTDRASDGATIGEYIVDYDGITSGIGQTNQSTDTYTQKIINTLARFNLTVTKEFKNISGTNLSTSLKEPVYIKLKRTDSSNTADSFNTGDSHVLTLDGNTDNESDIYESAAWVGTWKNLDRGRTVNSTYYYYTYYAVEMTAATGGTELTTGDYIDIPASNGNRFKVTNSGTFVVNENTATTSSSNMLTVTNTMASHLNVLKVDSSDNTSTLAGAVFSLTRTADGGGNAVSESAVTSSASSAGNGIAAFTGGLKDGTYTLTETQAPNGYAMHSGSITFTLTNGAVSNISANGSGMVGAAPTLITDSTTNEVTIQFTIANTAGTELPGTGTVFGLSRMGFAGLGTVLLTAFIVLYQYKKRRQYYGEWKED